MAVSVAFVASVILSLSVAATTAASAIPGLDRSPAPASAPSGATACPEDGTRAISLPGSHISLATDVAVLGGRLAWVVGMHAGQGRPRRAWIVRHTTSGWHQVAAAPTGSDGGLMAVDAYRSDLAWAIGFHTTGRFLRPVSQRWDGHRWIAASVPSSARSEALVDVSIASRASTWAVGFRTTARGPMPIALERRAGRWQRRDPGMAAGTFGALLAIDTAPDGEIWAAGWQGDGGSLRPLLLRFEDGRWSRVRTGLAVTAETVLTDVHARGSGRVDVLGFEHRGTELRSLLWRRDGSRWSADDQLGAIAGSMLPDGLTSDDAGRPVISGAYRGPGGGGFAAMMAVRMADEWRLVRAPERIRAPSHLRSVAWADGSAVAVGWTGGTGVAAAVCDASSLAVAVSAEPRPAALAHDGPVARHTRQRSAARQARADAPAVTAAGIRFRDVAGRVGLPGPTTSYGATVLDVDGDGWDDLLLSRHTERGRLLRNRHGIFHAAAGDPLSATDRHGCAAADIDRDGRVDAYCAVGAARGSKLKNNELWTDLDTADPRQVSVAFGVDDPLGRGRRATFLDLDGDPWPDLLVTSDPLRVDGLPSVGRAFVNDGGRRFLSAGDRGLELPIGGSCALSADLDGDGRDEVVICAEEAWGAGVGVHVFRRGGTRFQDVTRAIGITPTWDVDAAAADLDGDGRTDLVQLSRSRLAVSLQRSGRLVRVATIGVTAGTAIGIGDADGDGDPDLYVVEGGYGRNASDRLLLNRGSGRTFRSVAIPQTHLGTADDVVVLDHDHNGTDDFLVLNGASGVGPVQLIAGFRGRSGPDHDTLEGDSSRHPYTGARRAAATGRRHVN